MAIDTVPAGTPGATPLPPLVTHTTAGLLCGLFDRARPNLTAAELQALSGCDEPVGRMLDGISSLCSGLACLVMADGDGKAPAGNFQSASDVPELLLTVASIAEHASALMRLADAAETAEFIAGLPQGAGAKGGAA